MTIERFDIIYNKIPQDPPIIYTRSYPSIILNTLSYIITSIIHSPIIIHSP